MSEEAIEAAARAHWNENPPRERGAQAPIGETGSTYVFDSYVLWDDEDMRESDREVSRAKARAAVIAFLGSVDFELVQRLCCGDNRGGPCPCDTESSALDPACARSAKIALRSLIPAPRTGGGNT